MRDDFWLERWLSLLASKDEVLELGCGSGRDTKYLADRGFAVTATDKREEALTACARAVPEATCLQVDIEQPLPFADESYPLIVASLCLHYFSWQQTVEIVSEIRRCLEQNGRLFARFNSTNDVHFGAVGFREIEPNFYLVKGKSKRFFDHEALCGLFSKGWKIESLEEMTIARYDKPKVVWEVVVRGQADLT